MNNINYQTKQEKNMKEVLFEFKLHSKIITYRTLINHV